MSEKIKETWNKWSDGYYSENNVTVTAARLKANPVWAFPSVVQDMLKSSFHSFKGLKVLVPSSGDNCAAFAFHMLGAQVTSADISERQLCNAKRIADDNGWKIDFVCADSMSLCGIQDGEYDLVYTSNGVHVWIDDLLSMYKNFRRVLKPGGRYIMFEVHPINRPFDDSADAIKIHKRYEDIIVNSDPENYHWRIMDFLNALIKQEFTIERLEEFHAEAETPLSLWFYNTAAEAEADNYRKLDWTQNSWAALPQWIGISAKSVRRKSSMSIIKSHDITLYGGNKDNIILRPLCDEHLPLLYKWCADPEVLYWTEGGTNDTNLSYGPDTVHAIYGGVSQNAFCFLVEVNGVPIGECWLQKMNLPDVIAMYPNTLDVRRIDMSIGEKEYWNKGFGTQFIGMMTDFAFYGENVDVLHCFCEDYNIRSRRMWEKHGFRRVLTEPLEPQPQKGKFQFHYRLTRKEFIERRRTSCWAE